ncbi:DUF2336 domain-containing protein [Arsenicitalea aurantiaca]|nr:DUF2336 domain-containing protein [Arsenicitalea aurantiaca]
MVAYQDFVALCQSSDSEARGQAAHMAARAYLCHEGPADEHAALYAALIGFLDDPSVKVRAALAYGLLHATNAPRPVLLALLQDSAVIARAVAQYSPALVDADLIGLIRSGDAAILLAIALRERVSPRVALALIGRGERGVTLKLLSRREIGIAEDALTRLAEGPGLEDAELRGALLARGDLPAGARLLLVEHVAALLGGLRVVKGAIAPQRLERLMRDLTDSAATSIGEATAGEGTAYADTLIARQRISIRVLLHAVVNGHVMFFADCIAALGEMPRSKVFGLLERGSRTAIAAMLGRCGLEPEVSALLARLVLMAREADLADDVAARHFVVTALTEEILIEHCNAVPAALEEAFSYLSEQNVGLALKAARGVMAGFAGHRGGDALPLPSGEMRLALSAA